MLQMTGVKFGIRFRTTALQSVMESKVARLSPISSVRSEVFLGKEHLISIMVQFCREFEGRGEDNRSNSALPSVG